MQAGLGPNAPCLPNTTNPSCLQIFADLQAWPTERGDSNLTKGACDAPMPAAVRPSKRVANAAVLCVCEWALPGAKLGSHAAQICSNQGG